MKTFTALSLVAWISFPAPAAEPKAFTIGEIRLTVVSGPQETELRYRLKDGRMRIDRPGEIIPAPPVNLIELASGTLTILHPHNGAWQEIPAARLRRPQSGIAGLPGPPPGIGPQQLPAITPPGQAGHMPLDPDPVGPAKFAPRLPEIPRPPERPPLPTVPPPAAGVPGPPAIPAVPGITSPMVPGQAPPMELKATAEQREIHGYPCTRYTLAIPREGEMNLWLAGPGLLPPFHLLEADAPAPAPGRDEFAKVPALLRERDLFPLLAELNGEDGSPLVRWEVTVITPSTGEDDSLFQVPANFQPLAPP
jgi:hypothetical protein